MAFASVNLGTTVSGNKRFAFGTYTNGAADEGGDVVTGLNSVESISLTQTGTAVTTGAPVANETFPVTGGDVTIVTDADADGIWVAIGN